MLTGLISPLTGLLDKLIPDRAAREKAQAELARMEASGDLQLMLAQIGVNREEAAHKSLFVAGWRPAVGWLCVSVLAYHYLLADWAVLWFPEYAPRSGDGLETVLIGLLGVGGMRTVEKVRGVARRK